MLGRRQARREPHYYILWHKRTPRESRSDARALGTRIRAPQPSEPRRDRVNSRVIKRKLNYRPKKRAKHRDYPQPTKNFHKSIVLVE
jgi:hypothetical protein